MFEVPNFPSFPSLPRIPSRLIDAVLWLATAVSGGLTLWFSLAATPPGGSWLPGGDKAQHALAYFVTTLLLFLAAWWRPGRGPGPFHRFGWLLVGLVIVAGGLAELAQSAYTEYRTAEWGDWLMEYAAVLAAAYAVLQMEALSGRRQK